MQPESRLKLKQLELGASDSRLFFTTEALNDFLYRGKYTPHYVMIFQFTVILYVIPAFFILSISTHTVRAQFIVMKDQMNFAAQPSVGNTPRPT